MWNKTSTVHRDTKEQFQQAHRCVRFCCLSPAHLWCAVLTATTLAQGNWIKSVSVQMKNYECAKGNPSGKNQFTEDSCYASSFTDTWQQVALGTGLGINQNSRRNPCDLREQLPKIPKCPWESTRSARVSEHQPHPKHILGLLTQGKRTFGATSTGPWRNTSSKPRKHPYTTQAVPQLGKSLEGTSGKGGAAAGLVPTAKMHQAQTTECVTGPLSTAGLKPRATRLEVSGMSQSIQTASCSWRHFVSWKNQDTGTVWVTWLGLGHEAIVKMGRKYNCKSTKCKKTCKSPAGFNMGKVHAKGHVLERLYRRRLLSQPVVVLYLWMERAVTVPCVWALSQTSAHDTSGHTDLVLTATKAGKLTWPQLILLTFSLEVKLWFGVLIRSGKADTWHKLAWKHVWREKVTRSSDD